MKPVVKNGLRTTAILGLLTVVITQFVNCSEGMKSADKGGSNGGLSYPRKLELSGVPATNGIFDPSLARDPSSTRVWMSYSTVNPSVMWPTTTNPDAVSTRLAYSDDQGGSWVDAGMLIPFTDVDLVVLTQPPLNYDQSFRAGFWQSETSSLVYDSGATNAAEKWKLFTMRYIAIKGDRRFETSWIGLKMASTPQGLASAPELKLMVGAPYDINFNAGGGPFGVPVNGAPAIFAATQISSQLNGCVFAEPGLLSTPSALYLSMLCVKSTTDHRIVLLKCANPCNVTTVGGPNGWTYAGAPLLEADSVPFGGDSGFSAPNLFESNGNYYLIVTPMKKLPFDGYYAGCKVFRFANIDSGLLVKTGSTPNLIGSADGDAGSFNGACTFLPAANKAGVINSQLYDGVTERFNLFMTGLSF